MALVMHSVVKRKVYMYTKSSYVHYSCATCSVCTHANTNANTAPVVATAGVQAESVLLAAVAGSHHRSTAVVAADLQEHLHYTLPIIQCTCTYPRSHGASHDCLP